MGNNTSSSATPMRPQSCIDSFIDRKLDSILEDKSYTDCWQVYGYYMKMCSTTDCQPKMEYKDFCTYVASRTPYRFVPSSYALDSFHNKEAEEKWM